MNLDMLLAQVTLHYDNRPKALFGVVFFLAIALFATRHAFASNDHLSSPHVAKITGVSNPRIARAVCVVCAVVGWGAVFMMGAVLLGKWSPG